MNLEQLLREYIDIGVDDEEMQQIALASLAERIRGLKLQIAQAVNEARACLLLDNLNGSNQALKTAASLKKQYHYFYGEWHRLGGDRQADTLPSASPVAAEPSPSSQEAWSHG